MIALRRRFEREPTEVTVDDLGISARSHREIVLDLLVDGRRIFSFWLHRDGHLVDGRWRMSWPTSLREFLHGSALIAVLVHETGQEVFCDQVVLGDGRGAIQIVNAEGRLLSLDKSLRLVQTFDTRSAAHLQPLIKAIEQVLDALQGMGIDGFLAYGTLLGAVRDGKLIGHDSDADIGYVSRHDHPVDVIRESFAVQRAFGTLGYSITRYSALAFKVEVIEGDGSTRGLDVFGGFFRDGHLHLMGEIRVPFKMEWVYPVSRVVLEGVEFAAPADTDRFLKATYGEGWRVPDPAFHFGTPASTARRLNGWFRGLRRGRSRWARFYAKATSGVPSQSDFVEWVAEREPETRSFVDVGCGRGADTLWMARRGVSSLGLDFQPRAFKDAEARVDSADDASFWVFNLSELRQALVVAAIVARKEAPRVVMARHLVDAIGPAGRQRLWRTARMMLAGADGRLYLEFLVRKGDDGYAQRHKVRPRKPRLIAAELRAAGATVVHRDVSRVGGSDGRPSRVCRMVIEWKA